MSPVRCRILILIVLAASGPDRLLAETGSGTRYALICTVERYYTTSLTLLGHADQDGHALAEVLAHAGWKVTFLNTDPGRATATLGQLRSSMAMVGKRCGPDDMLLFVFVGHGLQAIGSRPQCLALRDTEADDPATALPLHELYNWMSDCRAGTKLMLLDACRSAPTRRVIIPPLDSPQVPPAGIAALYSCSSGEVGQESDAEKHGLFLKCVVDGLGGGAMGPDRTVTFAGLRDYVAREVPRAADRLSRGTRQRPRELAAILGPSPVLLTVPVEPPTPPAPTATSTTGNSTNRRGTEAAAPPAVRVERNSDYLWLLLVALTVFLALVLGTMFVGLSHRCPRRECRRWFALRFRDRVELRRERFVRYVWRTQHTFGTVHRDRGPGHPAGHDTFQGFTRVRVPVSMVRVEYRDTYVCSFCKELAEYEVVKESEEG